MAALPGSERETLERFRAALGEARELMRRAERDARRGMWHDTAQELKAARDKLDLSEYEFIRKMRAAGLSWPAIGRELEERNWNAVYRRYQRLERRFGQAQLTDEDTAGEDEETPG